MPAAHPWTADEAYQLIMARVHRVSWETLEEEHRRDRKSLVAKLESLARDPAYAVLIARIPADRKSPPARAAVKSTTPTPLTIDRDRRRELRFAREAAGDATPVFFGDPLPGYSALDKKLEGAR